MLGIGIEKIEYLEREKDLRADPYSKGVRIDVYVRDSSRVFTLEMHCNDRKDLSLRTRYYQGLQDISFLDKGNMYRHLPESYILFICLFDLFGKGLPVYTFENTCREDRRISLNDKCRKIFYNVNAWEKERNPERRVLLEYFFGAEPNDELTRAMDEQVSFTRNLRQWRKEHMTLEQEIKLQASYACDDGFSHGLSQGISQGAFDAKVEAAKLMLVNNIDAATVSKCTGLSADEINQIAEGNS